MRIVDISSYQALTAATKAYIEQAEAVIIKVTQGTSYVNPYWKQQLSYAISKGKLTGLYHYASGGSVTAEANFFVSTIGPFGRNCLLFVDWESGSNRSWGSATWSLSFSNTVYALTNKRAHPYVAASAIGQVANMASNHVLWVAGYPVNANSWTVPRFPYNVSPWESYTLWQFTSNGIDRSTSNLTAAQWVSLATNNEISSVSTLRTSGNEDDMPNQMLYCCRKGTDGKGAVIGPMKFFDGSRIHPLSHPDEMKAIRMTYRNNTGKNLPSFTFTTEPWMARFEAAIKRVA